MKCDKCGKRSVGVVGFRGRYLCYTCAEAIYGSLERALEAARKKAVSGAGR